MESVYICPLVMLSLSLVIGLFQKKLLVVIIFEGVIFVLTCFILSTSSESVPVIPLFFILMIFMVVESVFCISVLVRSGRFSFSSSEVSLKF